MKRILWIIVTVMILMSILASCGGKVDGVKRIIGQSDFFTPEEIDDAMDTVSFFFYWDFRGCTLTELAYDEGYSLKGSASWAARYGEEEAIVLLSRFLVDESGGDGSLLPNSTYEGYQWILTRSRGGRWVLRCWGYA